MQIVSNDSGLPLPEYGIYLTGPAASAAAEGEAAQMNPPPQLTVWSAPAKAAARRTCRHRTFPFQTGCRATPCFVEPR